jgi:S1-C subfamily serine protease
MRAALLVTAFAMAVPAAVEAASGLDATVFIRVTGALRGEYQHAWKESVEIHDVPVATGSGFVISPGGYILTNHHVVAAPDRVIERDGQEVTVQVEVTRIEVLFPADGTRLEARVEASDPETDLALLSVGGVDLPFIGLGDSDALRPGQPIQVTGFPLGRAVDVGKSAGAPAAVPQATVSRGSVAAMRTGDEGDARYIQTDAAVQPGSSGGPMVDEQGYAVGVIRMMLGRRPGVAFAIPINRVKDFLQASGHERVFPARRLTLGALQSFDRKGLRLRVPDAFEDVSTSRLRVEWTPPDEVSLVAERVATPLSLADVEAALLAGRDFAGFAAATAPAGRRTRLGGRTGVVGWASGSAPDGQPLEIGYAIVDLGAEKVVARYAGAPAQVAFNRSIFGGSLESLEADPLLTAEVTAPLPAVLEPLRLPHRAADLGPYPAGWYAEPAEFSACTGLPAPEGAIVLSPEGDFTVALRVGWWRAPAPAREEALAACGAARDFFAFRDERLGLVRQVQGSFLSRAGELWGFEMVAPPAKQPFVRDLFGTWIDTLTQAEGP